MKTLVPVLLAVFLTPLCAWAQPAITTSFTSTLGGWTGENIRQRIANGNPGGYARFDDNPNQPNDVIVAPSQYLGSWLGYKDVGALSYDHKILAIAGVNWSVIDYQVSIFGPQDSAVWLHPGASGENQWTRLVAPIKESAWAVVGNWNQLLANITRVEIRIEHVADNTGNDVEGIDNIKLYVLPPASADFDNNDDVDGSDFLNWQRNAGTGTQLSQGDSNDTATVDSVDLRIWGGQYDDGSLPPVADFDIDDDVDGRDFLTWQRNAGKGTQFSQGDTNYTGTVDGADLGHWATQYGVSTPISAVPEPTTSALLLVGCMWARVRIRRQRSC